MKTVKVPLEFDPLFEKAAELVAQQFKHKKEMPERGAIEIAGDRYVLIRAASLSVGFFETIATLYKDQGHGVASEITKQILFDLAHAIGKLDAKNFHEKFKLTDPIEKLSVGPIHFAYTGWALVEILPGSKPSTDENYYLIYNHPYSFEAHSWLKVGKKSCFPVCIMNAGYSSGWCEESFGVELVASEITCKARGDDNCCFIMGHPSKMQGYIKNYGKDNPVLAKKIVSYSPPGLFVKRRIVSELAELANSDELTGLANRRYFKTAADLSIAYAERHDQALALLLIDLDNFKEVNDTFGHDVGDLMLRMVGLRIKAACRSDDFIARIGGDEFIVIVSDLKTSDDANVLARKINEKLKELYDLDGKQIKSSASIGVAVFPVDGTDLTVLFKNADIAMYKAKKAGGDGYKFFSNESSR